MRGQRLAVLAQALAALAVPLLALEHEVPVVEHRQDLAGAHDVAGAHPRVGHVAVHRRGDHALHRAFQRRVGGHAVGAGSERHEGAERDERERRQLEREMAGAEQRGEQIAPGGADLGDEPAILAALDLQHRSHEGGEARAVRHRGAVEGPVCGALQGERAEELAVGAEGNAAHRAGAVQARELGLRAGDLQLAVLGLGIDHRFVLIDCLVHRRADGPHEVALVPEVGAVRERVDARVPPAAKADAHPVAAEPGGELRGERRDRAAIALVLERERDHLQHRGELGSRGEGLAPRQHLEPRHAPLELTHDAAQLLVAAGADGERGDPAELPVDEHRIGEGVEAGLGFRRAHHAAALVHGELGDRGQLRVRLGIRRTRGERHERPLVGLAQHDHRGLHAADDAALDVEPGRGEGLRRVGLGEAAPQRRIEIGEVAGVGPGAGYGLFAVGALHDR